MKRELRFLDVLCIGINAVVGSGIFLFPGKLAALMGPVSIYVFPLCGLALFPIAVCFSRLSEKYENTGGSYLYARDAFGAWIGVSVGWMAWVVLVLSYAAVANAISAYLAHFMVGFSTVAATKLTACSVIIGLGVLNYLGIKPASRTTDFFALAKLLPLGIFIFVGIFFVRPDNLPGFSLPSSWTGLGPALFLAFFAFQGFENIPVPSGEAARPRKDAPLAVVLTLFSCGILYFFVQSVAVGVDPNLALSSKPLADAGKVFLGSGGALLIAAGAAVSTMGYTAGAALVAPRYLYALSKDGFLPSFFSQSHPKFSSPYGAVLVTTLCTLLAALFLNFDKLVDLSNVTICFQYGATCLAAWKLLKLPGSFLMPLLGFVVLGFLIGQASFQEWVMSFLALLSGLFLCFVYRFFKTTDTYPPPGTARG